MKNYCKSCEHDEDIGFCDKCFYNHILEERGIPPTEYEARPKPQTNADRIRAMTDEELAKTFADYVYCHCCPIPYCKVRFTMERLGCQANWIDWLRQEADDGKEEKEENQPAK